MTIPTRRTALLGALGAASVLALTACGSDTGSTAASSSTPSSSTSASASASLSGAAGSAAASGVGSSAAGSGAAGPVPNPVTGFDAPAVDPKIAAMVPQELRSKPALIAGVDATMAPKEFMDADGKTIVGLDVDMVKAMGDVLGVKIEFVNAAFDTLIPGVQNGRMDLVNSSAAPTLEREKVVDMVSTDLSGEQLLIQAAQSDAIKGMDDLCGRSAGAARGSLPVTDLQDQSAKCTGAGKKPVDVQIFPDSNTLTLALTSGRIEAVLSDQPTSAYNAAKSNGKLAAVGPIYRAGLEAVFTKKGNGLAPALAAAMNKLRETGTYKQMLAKWDLTASYLDTSVVNPATNKQKY
ncbi:ABC transporter substrate-binding protein [Nakamurella endophytica]|uniref:ABC transporter substrate-binding protein n=1 Tax=Nakamurella endophytica TaxID=1748367 RepID=A0A917WEX6_9ACTN|nr:ABC transporter substrate-binding protein [Nakamurella endophytica]GGL98453.1 ABC transporter substrate-binding protein [Nakamurella endophytica]